ncbi:MAG TPA: DUF4956 domain-containing protein [Gemmatimonadaceae bacterium]|nr:DUF4956 domain-containing protein [Gemmatimonadaceae bacterium]
MSVFTRAIDLLTLGSDRPIRRLIAYYVVLAAVAAALAAIFPAADRLLLGRGITLPEASPIVLQDALVATESTADALGANSFTELALTTALLLLGTLMLMLPVSWVYMSARREPGHSQAVAQTLLILPIVVAGIVLIVRNSLALAFSLAGVVAAVRFRNTMRDARDLVFIFLAIAVGFSAGVQTLAVGAVLSLVFNLVLLLTWRYDFGRSALAPTASSQWREPLATLATSNGNGTVPDRDIVLALTPDKVDLLADRFERVRDVLGSDRKKPRFNAVFSFTTNSIAEAQVLVQKVLDKMTKRWMLDEVVTHSGKPSEVYYLVRMRKAVSRDDLLTAIRARAGDRIGSAHLELGEAAVEQQEAV